MEGLGLIRVEVCRLLVWRDEKDGEETGIRD